MKAATFLIAFLFLSGCAQMAAVSHTFDSSDPHPEYQAWAQAEAKRLAPIYGTDPDLYTRLLDIPRVADGIRGWYDGMRITICLRNDNGTPIDPRVFRNVWHHEWNHHRHGDIRLDEHEAEYQNELAVMGLWEYPPSTDAPEASPVAPAPGGG